MDNNIYLNNEYSFEEIPNFSLGADFYELQDLQDQQNMSVNSSQEEIDSFIVEQKSTNTVRKTILDMNILQRYMKTINMENVNIENLPPSELNHLLSKFFIHARKKDGEEYEPDTLSSYQRSIHRYLGDKKSKVNILKDEELEESRKVLVAKRRVLVHKHGKGNKPQAAEALSEIEEDALFNSGEFGDSNPSALQKVMWWLLSLHFGFRARDESRKLRWGDVALQIDPNTGLEMLVWQKERGTKTRTGKEHGHQRAFQPKVFATNTDRCPVKYYKIFKSHRPSEMNLPDSPFYLAVKQHMNPSDAVWYMKAPLGKNEIGKFMASAAEKAGLNVSGKKITNHSVRKTCISRLLDASVPETFVAQLSGHKNINSLQNYKTASTSQQRQMSSVLSRVDQQASTSSAITTVQSAKTISTTDYHNSLQGLANHNSLQGLATDPMLSSTAQIQAVFSGASINSISDCTFQIIKGSVTMKKGRKRRLIIESDDEVDD